MPESEQRAALEVHAARAQASLDLGTGPLLRAVCFDLGADRPGRLLLVIHHLVVDGVSWRVLLEDIQQVHGAQLGQGQAWHLPAKTTSFQRWAERLVEHARGPALDAEVGFWTGQGWDEVRPLPRDGAGGANTAGSAETVSLTLSVEETEALLQRVPQAYHTQINDVLLTGRAQALRGWTGQPTRCWSVDLEGHGREEDLSLKAWTSVAYRGMVHDDLPGGAGRARSAGRRAGRRAQGGQGAAAGACRIEASATACCATFASARRRSGFLCHAARVAVGGQLQLPRPARAEGVRRRGREERGPRGRCCAPRRGVERVGTTDGGGARAHLLSDIGGMVVGRSAAGERDVQLGDVHAREATIEALAAQGFAIEQLREPDRALP